MNDIPTIVVIVALLIALLVQYRANRRLLEQRTRFERHVRGQLGILVTMIHALGRPERGPEKPDMTDPLGQMGRAQALDFWYQQFNKDERAYESKRS